MAKAIVESIIPWSGVRIPHGLLIFIEAIMKKLFVLFFLTVFIGCEPPQAEVNSYYYDELKKQSEAITNYKKILKEVPPKYLDCYASTAKAVDNYNSKVQEFLIDNIVTNEEYDKIKSSFKEVNLTYEAAELAKKKKEILEASETSGK